MLFLCLVLNSALNLSGVLAEPLLPASTKNRLIVGIETDSYVLGKIVRVHLTTE